MITGRAVKKTKEIKFKVRDDGWYEVPDSDGGIEVISEELFKIRYTIMECNNDAND